MKMVELTFDQIRQSVKDGDKVIVSELNLSTLERGFVDIPNDQILEWSITNWLMSIFHLYVMKSELSDIEINSHYDLRLQTTPLIIASQCGFEDAVRRLLDRNAEVNATDAFGNTALHRAFENRRINIAKMLLAKGANINAKNTKGQTPLHTLFESGVPIDEFKKWMNLINTYKGNVLEQDRNGHTPRQLLLRKKDQNYLKSFFKEFYPGIPEDSHSFFFKKECIRELESDQTITLLHLAIFNQAFGLIKILIDLGFDINAKYKGGFTALFYACNWERSDSYVEYLIRLGAEVTARDDDNNTPLHWTARHSNFECLCALVKSGADLNAVNKNGETPLHCAAMSYDVFEITQVLIKKGADLSLRNAKGQTALEVAQAGQNNSFLHAYEMCKTTPKQEVQSTSINSGYQASVHHVPSHTTPTTVVQKNVEQSILNSIGSSLTTLGDFVFGPN